MFYGIFGPLAPRQEFAFIKTAQYFPALSVVGRFDLLLIYMMTVVLLFYYSFVLQSSVLCFARAIGTEKRVLIPLACLFLRRGEKKRSENGEKGPPEGNKGAGEVSRA